MGYTKFEMLIRHPGRMLSTAGYEAGIKKSWNKDINFERHRCIDGILYPKAG